MPSAVTVKVVRSKYSLTLRKLLQKVSQLILVGFRVIFNILKVYQRRNPGKGFFQDGVQDGRRNVLMIITMQLSTQI